MPQSRKRGSKTYRLNYSFINDEPTSAIQILDNPAEIKIQANDKSFITVREGGVSFSAGIGNQFNFQGLPQNFRYGGMLQDLPFPLSIIPTTPFTPWPNQIIAPPLAPIMDTLRLVTGIASFFV